MRIKKGFKLDDICGQKVVMAYGEENIDFSKVISLNDSAAVMWYRAIESGDFSVDLLADALVDAYEVDRATALSDAAEVVDRWTELGLTE